MKKLWSLLLVLCLAASFVSFAVAEEVDPYGPVSDEKIVITVGREESANIAYDEGENSADNYIIDYLEEKLNVEYQYAFSVDPSTYNTKVNMTIASGELPDVMNVNYMQLVELVEADAIEDMTEAFATYASEGLKGCFESTGGITVDLATFDGKMMAIGDICPSMDCVPVLWVRADWLEECGLEAPSTLEEIINVANTFKEKNPGGNVTTGIAAQEEIVNTNGDAYTLNALFNYCRAYPEQWITDANGEVVYGSLTPETKEALAGIRSLVEQGILNDSLAVTTGDQCYELIANGNAGMFFGCWWSGQWPVVNIMGNSTEEDIAFTPILPLANPETGKFEVCTKNPTNTFIVVRKGASEDIKEAVVKTVNYQYDLDQGQAEGIRPNGMDSNFSWHYFPINVLHCDYDAKDVQIKEVMEVVNGTRDYDDQCGDGKTWYNGYTTVMEQGFRAAYDLNVSTANAWGWATGALCVQSAGDTVHRFPAATYADTKSMEKYWSALETLEDEYFLKVITGEASIDDFDQFVADWYSMGGDVITEEVKAYIASK